MIATVVVVVVAVACVLALGGSAIGSPIGNHVVVDLPEYVGFKADDAKFECAWRSLAYEYGRALMPRQGSFTSLFAALQLQACNQTEPLPTPAHSPFVRNNAMPAREAMKGLAALFVDPVHGSDSNTGSLVSPFATIQHAV